MACNCKKTNEFQDKHGEPEEENAFEKSQRGFFDWNIENGGMISVKLSPAEWNKRNQVLAMLL